MKHNKSIRVPYGFIQLANGNYECDYSMYNEEKSLELKPLAMAMLLKEYEFIDSFLATTESVYVRFTPLESNQETQLLEKFMYDLPQYHSLIIIEEYEKRQCNRQEVAKAFNLSCDKHQFEKVIN